MARIRSVSPDICVSETMADISAELERTFVRLWTHCDDHGRAIDNTKLIKAAIFPLVDAMTAETIDSDLDDLQAVGLIIRYEAGGKRYLAIRSWDEYQHPQRPTPSKYPEPPEHVTEVSRTRPRANTEPSRPGGERERELGEGEGVLALDEPARNGHGTVPAKKPRARDPIWEALLAVCGVDLTQVTTTARGRYNKAAKDLRDIGADAEGIGRRALVFRTRWPDASLTPSALASRWGECDPDRQHAPVNETNTMLERLMAEGRAAESGLNA